MLKDSEMMVPRTRRSLEEAFQALEDLVVSLFFDVLRIHFIEQSCRMPLERRNPSPVLRNSERLSVNCSKLRWTGKPTGTKFSFPFKVIIIKVRSYGGSCLVSTVRKCYMHINTVSCP